MHSSGGFELTKLIYTRLEDNNLISHRGDRSMVMHDNKTLSTPPPLPTRLPLASCRPWSVTPCAKNGDRRGRWDDWHEARSFTAPHSLPRNPPSFPPWRSRPVGGWGCWPSIPRCPKLSTARRTWQACGPVRRRTHATSRTNVPGILLATDATVTPMFVEGCSPLEELSVFHPKKLIIMKKNWWSALMAYSRCIHRMIYTAQQEEGLEVLPRFSSPLFVVTKA